MGRHLHRDGVESILMLMLILNLNPREKELMPWEDIYIGMALSRAASGSGLVSGART